MADVLIASRKCACRDSVLGLERMLFDIKIGAMVILIIIKN